MPDYEIKTIPIASYVFTGLFIIIGFYMMVRVSSLSWYTRSYIYDLIIMFFMFIFIILFLKRIQLGPGTPYFNKNPYKDKTSTWEPSSMGSTTSTWETPSVDSEDS
jgi:hypothetical protein